MSVNGKLFNKTIISGIIKKNMQGEPMKSNYKEFFNKKIILRLDFDNEINTDEIHNTAVSDSVINEIKKSFPMQQKDQIVKIQSVTNDFVHNKEVLRINKSIIQRSFAMQNKKAKCVISPYLLSLEFSEYFDFDEIMKNLERLLSIIYEQVTDLQTTRIGLRYIYLFDETTKKPQKNFFNSYISNFVNLKFGSKVKPKLSRIITKSEFVIDDDMRLVFNFGLHNKQYPSILSDNSFILDYDASCNAIINDSDSIIDKVRKGYSSIMDLLDNSISDVLKVQ